MLTTLWFALKIKFVLKIRKQCVGDFNGFFLITKQIKKPYDCALFCCKALKCSGLESTQEEGRNTRLRLVFRPTLL